MTGDEKKKRSKLRLVAGGKSRCARVGPVRIIAAPAQESPFPLEAVAAEEDTWLVLSTDSRIIEQHDHPIRVMTEVWEAAPEKPGEVVVKPGRPLRLLAVVHDFNADPTFREEWVASALDGIFEETARRELASIGLPLLGTLHGTLQPAAFLALLETAIERAGAQAPERVWLILQEERYREILDILDASAGWRPTP
ncbi:MAG: hypothetical protein ACE5HV_12690 [Acidobacteriota bacterium]